jgi:hypothetical protein
MHGQNRSMRQADDYAEEVKALGGKSPPMWISKRVRTAFELVSSATNVLMFRKAAASLHRSAA